MKGFHNFEEYIKNGAENGPSRGAEDEAQDRTLFNMKWAFW